MRKNITKEQITLWVETALQGSDAFIYEVKLHDGDKIVVYIDADEGVNIHRCADVSRYIDEQIEAMVPEHPYSIEVSSPGADKPLKLLRQYHKHIGRKLDITLKDGKVVTNMLKEVSADGLLVGEKITNLLTKRKPKPDIHIPFDTIAESSVVISFN